MSVRVSWVRLGLCLAFVGGVFTIVSYASWSPLVASYQQQCTGGMQATSCASLSLSVGIWAPMVAGSVALLIAGLAIAAAARLRERRAPRGAMG